jgi:hypothetical protein
MPSQCPYVYESSNDAGKSAEDTVNMRNNAKSIFTGILTRIPAPNVACEDCEDSEDKNLSFRNGSHTGVVFFGGRGR